MNTGKRSPSARVANLRPHVLDRWAAGKYDSEIAAELGLSEGDVHGIIARSYSPEAEKAKQDHFRNKALRERKKFQTPESLAREARALRLWADGASAGDIAIEFGVSRNAVMGIISRATGEAAEAAKRAHAAIFAQRLGAPPPRAKREKPPGLSAQARTERLKAVMGRAAIAKFELTLIDNPAFVAPVEPEPDVYAHMRSERSLSDALAALTRDRKTGEIFHGQA
jgi:DNA-binding CsgD family transcriptional regulator